MCEELLVDITGHFSIQSLGELEWYLGCAVSVARREGCHNDEPVGHSVPGHPLKFGTSMGNNLQWHFFGCGENEGDSCVARGVGMCPRDKVFTRKSLSISLFKRNRIGVMTPRDGK